jgi:4a-hydroxytetrahydrobiopterin dehydratase
MTHTNWEIINNELCKTFVFADFTSAMSWMVKAAFIIEKHNHHPSWTNTYNKVSVKLCTHDAGNIITEKDYALSKELDRIG